MFYQRPQSGGLILLEKKLGLRWVLIILLGLLHLFYDFSDRIYDIAKIHIPAPFMIEGHTNYF